jgi:type I restriction enzyme S subunit
MNNWKQQKLGIVADVKLSNVDKLTIENERVVRLCNYTDVYKNSFINNEKSESFMLASCNENEYEKFILKKGQVAITKDSETPNDIGVSSYISEDFKDVVLGYHLALITPDNDKLNGQFLHYWLNTKQAKRYFENNAGGSGQRCTLVLDCIKSTPLYLPKLSTQVKIAKVLSDLDTKIELNNRINRELEAMAKTLYDYWFVQFDFPNEQGKPYKSSGGKMVYNAELKREIPEGWVVKKLSDIATTGSGGTPLSTKKEYYENGNIPWINSGEVNMPFIVSTKNFITQKGLENSSAKMFKRGTILMAMYGATAGKVSFIDIEACTNQAICAINPKEDFHRIYIKLMLEDLYKYLINLSSGSARDNLSQDKIRELKFVIPSKSLIQKFDIIVQSTMNKILINLKQNQQLKELRDWLLPMLMNGQVTVKEAEESLSMAAEPSVEYKKG